MLERKTVSNRVLAIVVAAGRTILYSEYFILREEAAGNGMFVPWCAAGGFHLFLSWSHVLFA
jgi:hypothetical protein